MTNYTRQQIVRISELDAAIDSAADHGDEVFFAAVAAKDEYIDSQGIDRNRLEVTGREVLNYIEQAAETTEAGQAIQAHLRQVCEHKIALHVDASIGVVDTDPEEADAWAYEAGKEAWEFDLQTPEKLASHPALSAAFKRGFDSVEQLSRSQRDVAESIPPATSLAEYQALLGRFRAADGTAKSSDITDAIRDVAIRDVEVVSEALRLSPFGHDAQGRVVARNLDKPHPKLPLQEFFDSAPESSLGLLPAEATFSTVQYCIESDEMPGMLEAVEVFKSVPAKLLEIPVNAVKAAFMVSPEIAESFSTFDDYHRWYLGAGDVPVYGAASRWPCIASCMEDEVVGDGSHRLHSYIAAGHATIPVLQYDCEAWWKAHERWKQSSEVEVEDRPSLGMQLSKYIGPLI